MKREVDMDLDAPAYPLAWPGAPRDTVLSAHRELSRKTHPDVEGGDAEQFKRVQEALALSGHGRAKG